MQETKLLNEIKLHDKLAIRISSNANNFLPRDVLKKLLQPHRTANYFFLFVNSGRSVHTIDLQNVIVSAGQLLFVLPNQIHLPTQKNNDLEYFKLSFDENCLALLPQCFPFLINPLNQQIIEFDFSSKQRIKAIFENLENLLHSNEKPVGIILAHLNTLLTEFNYAYFKSIDQNKFSNLKLSKFIEFKLNVEKNLAEQPSIREIAKKLAVTSSYLFGVVKEFSGVSPKEFITNRLIIEAQRKLHYTNLSVKELAYELGFNDPGYFSRLFKKNTGKSVTQYLVDMQDLSGN